MDIQYYGANCLRISNKEATVVVDDTLKAYGKKSITKPGNIALFTAQGADTSTAKDAKIALTMPGEYEISDISITGIPARAHTDESGTNATIYRLIVNDIRIAVLGHIHPEIADEKLEEVGTVDVLITPVGGNGYTIDPAGASSLIKKIDPKIIIPTHYAIAGFPYEVPQQPLDEVLKALAMEPEETTPKLKLKSAAALPEAKQLIILEPQV